MSYALELNFVEKVIRQSTRKLIGTPVEGIEEKLKEATTGVLKQLFERYNLDKPDVEVKRLESDPSVMEISVHYPNRWKFTMWEDGK